VSKVSYRQRSVGHFPTFPEEKLSCTVSALESPDRDLSITCSQQAHACIRLSKVWQGLFYSSKEFLTQLKT